MKNNSSDPDYSNWFLQLKQKFQLTQIKAAVQVNQALLKFYWELGADIVYKQAEKNWGSKFLENLSIDLQREFPEVKGFSIEISNTFGNGIYFIINLGNKLLPIWRKKQPRQTEKM